MMSGQTSGDRADAVPHVIVLTGGDPVLPSLADDLPGDAYVIAADSGLELAAALGLEVDLVVGDFDSVDREVLRRAEKAGAEIERHPEAKDRTDLAIAMDAAAARGPAEVVVVGGAGGRLDHLLGNVLLLAAEPYRDLDIRAHVGPATLYVVRREVAFEGRRGEYVTLVPLHGDAQGVTTTGLLYPLEDATLTAGSTRGVSNELVGGHATVRLTGGTLAVVRPGGLGTHARAQLDTGRNPT